MKPNLIIVQAAHPEMDHEIERCCEELCDSSYVYLIRPDSKFRADSPAGVRFLNHPLERLPGFAQVEAFIFVGDPESAGRVKDRYAGSHFDVWNPQDERALPELLNRLISPTVVQGDFSTPQERRLARAM